MVQVFDVFLTNKCTDFNKKILWNPPPQKKTHQTTPKTPKHPKSIKES
jgi:hypothetical protein